MTSELDGRSFRSHSLWRDACSGESQRAIGEGTTVPGRLGEGSREAALRLPRRVLLHDYIERRSVIIVLAAYVVLLAAIASITYLIWGAPQRIPVGLCAMFYWLAAWPLYLRHHYKPEFRKPDAREGREMYEERP